MSKVADEICVVSKIDLAEAATAAQMGWQGDLVFCRQPVSFDHMSIITRGQHLHISRGFKCVVLLNRVGIK